MAVFDLGINWLELLEIGKYGHLENTIFSLVLWEGHSVTSLQSDSVLKNSQTMFKENIFDILKSSRNECNWEFVFVYCA